MLRAEPKINWWELIPKAIKTAAVVGSVLVSINQFEAVYGSAEINGLKVVLTYCVPFCVYLYSAMNTAKALAKRG
jgi:Mg/Co/Ni transporter MgtE